MTGILEIIGSLLKFGVTWFVGKNTKEIVARQEAQNVAVNTDEIRSLIHESHFGASPEKKQAALDELRRRGAIT